MNNEIIFDNAKDFINNLACVEINGKWGIINTKGDLVLDFIYEDLNGQQGENTYTAKLNGKYGLIDLDQNVIIDFQYDSLWVSQFNNGTFQAELNNKHGIIDKNNNIILDFKYENFQPLGFKQDEKYIVAYLNDKCGILDINENIVIPFEYNNYFVLENNLLIANQGGLWGVIDLSNNPIIPCRYKHMNFWPEDNFCVETQYEKWILINKNEEKICRKEFDYIIDFYEGNKLFPAMIDHKWGFIDKAGVVKIGLSYEEAAAFTDGLAPICLNDKYGMIDENENVIIPLEYDSPYFVTGEAWVSAEKDDKWGVIDYDNNIIADFIYENYILDFSYDFAVVKINDKYGYINKKGQRLKLSKTIYSHLYDTQNQRGL